MDDIDVAPETRRPSERRARFTDAITIDPASSPSTSPRRQTRPRRASSKMKDLEKNESNQPVKRRFSLATVDEAAITLYERLRHFTFAWYTLPMSTGGIALLMALTPHRFPGLTTIGLVIFIFDLICLFLITVALLLRFALHHKTFGKAFTHPTEALFVPTFFLALAAALANAEHYGVPHSGPWLITALRVSFWVYLTLTFAFGVLMYHMLFSNKRHLSLDATTPAWILPIFPVMLAGTLAGFFSPYQPPVDALPMLAAGLAAQGLGFLVSVFMYAAYLSRLMAYGLPMHRPGMFIAVGPPSFTAAAFVSIGGDFPRVLQGVATSTGASDGVTASFLVGISDPLLVGQAVRLVALASAVFLWALAFWFFASAIVASLRMPDRSFHLSWWSLVFPNVGFTVACIRIGEAFGNEGVLWFSSVLTCALVAVWVFVGFCCARAVFRREIMFPGRDEDSD